METSLPSSHAVVNQTQLPEYKLNKPVTWAHITVVALAIIAALGLSLASAPTAIVVCVAIFAIGATTSVISDVIQTINLHRDMKKLIKDKQKGEKINPQRALRLYLYTVRSDPNRKLLKSLIKNPTDLIKNAYLDRQVEMLPALLSEMAEKTGPWSMDAINEGIQATLTPLSPRPSHYKDPYEHFTIPFVKALKKLKLEKRNPLLLQAIAQHNGTQFKDALAELGYSKKYQSNIYKAAMQSPLDADNLNCLIDSRYAKLHPQDLQRARNLANHLHTTVEKQERKDFEKAQQKAFIHLMRSNPTGEHLQSLKRFVKTPQRLMQLAYQTGYVQSLPSLLSRMQDESGIWSEKWIKHAITMQMQSIVKQYAQTLRITRASSLYQTLHNHLATYFTEPFMRGIILQTKEERKLDYLQPLTATELDYDGPYRHTRKGDERTDGLDKLLKANTHNESLLAIALSRIVRHNRQSIPSNLLATAIKNIFYPTTELAERSTEEQRKRIAHALFDLHAPHATHRQYQVVSMSVSEYQASYRQGNRELPKTYEGWLAIMQRASQAT